jgi:DNA-binding GntR family transcriptional regulator
LGAGLLVEKLTPQMEETLWNAFNALVAACDLGDEAAIAAKDLEFHKTIVELSGHRRLMDQFRLVEQHIRLYIVWSDAIMPSWTEIIDTHRPIVEAIIERDTEKAQRILREHNEIAGRNLVAFLDENDVSAGKRRIAQSTSR